MRVAGSHRRSAVASVAALLVAALAAVACGDRGPDPSPSPPPTEGDGDPAPGGGGEPAPDGGDPAPGGGGAPAPDGGGGGVPSDACAGLAPTFGDAVEVKFDTGTHRDCSVARTSGSGQVALGVHGSFAGSVGTVFSLYAADGSATVGTIDGFLQNVLFFTDDVDPWFHPTSRGYQGMVHPGNGASPLPFRTWDAGGQLVAETPGYAVSSAPDRNGGSLLLERVFDASNPATTLGPTQLQWIDASGQITRAVTLDRDAQLVLSNWATGHAVVVMPGSPGSARWFDESGLALTPWFDVGDVSDQAMSLHLLLDGTVAIRSGERWEVALPDGAASPGTVPAWLGSRPSTRLATIRQGRAYAVLPATSAPDATRFEIVAASGQSCGSFSIPPAAVLPGEARSPRRLDVGYDGTLLQTSGLTLTPPGFGIHCAFRWWPKLLQ